jgi:hypothetical protein
VLSSRATEGPYKSRANLGDVNQLFNQVDFAGFAANLSALATSFDSAAASYNTGVITPATTNITAVETSPFAAYNTSFSESDVRRAS